MKVAHIKSPYLPLSETFIYNYVNGAKKYKPIIISEYQINSKEFPAEDILTHKNNKELNPFLKKVRYFLAGKIQRELIFNKFYKDSLNQIKPSMVHIHFGVPGLMLSRITKKMNLPLLVSFYGFDLSQIPNVLGKDVYKKNKLFDNGSIFTAEGNYAKNSLLNLGCPENKAHLLRIGININNYKSVDRQSLKKNQIKLLFCGRFVEKKGLLVAIKALAKVIDKNQNIILNIIGDGPQKKEAESLIKELDIKKNVNFLGFLNHSEFISECYSNHIFIAPSKTDSITRETEGGAPTVLIEAQATGMPVIASNHADIPEIVINEKSGLIFKENDTNQLAESILELVKMKNLWSQMGEYGRKHVFSQHDIEFIIPQLEELYDKARKGRFEK